MVSWRILEGDCVTRLRELDAGSVDAVVCDPPYGLEFMGKEWDRLSGQGWHEEWVREALRVLKPGGHLLAFGGTRTYHRLACAVEDAGFEIRDCIAWMYGSGFPKSLDVSKAIDKAAGAERQQTGREPRLVSPRAMAPGGAARMADPGARFDEAVTPEAERWQGWGTALKPAYEPIVVARRPLSGTVAGNVLVHGTGALNIGGCRVNPGEAVGGGGNGQANVGGIMGPKTGTRPRVESHDAGRWPANVVLDEDAAAMLDEQSGELPAGVAVRKNGISDAGIFGFGNRGPEADVSYADSGGASRFFYCAKASSAERGTANTHPTVKPVEVMRWLVRLVTPPGGLVLDPFAGSGTTGIAAMREGFSFVGIERDPAYVAIARERIRDDAPLFNIHAEAV